MAPVTNSAETVPLPPVVSKVMVNSVCPANLIYFSLPSRASKCLLM